MEDKKEETKIEKVEKETKTEVAEAEKEIAMEIPKIEDKVEKNKINQTEADKKINKEIKEVTKEETEKDKKKSEKKKDKSTTSKPEAVVNGKDIPISTKHAIAICDFIRHKTIEEAMFLLSEVLQFKRAVPMKGEIPHRKGNIMSGRYPIKACEHFLKLLRQLAANASVNEIEIERVKIECKANRANRPHGRFGNTRTKRSHVTLRVKVNKKKAKKKTTKSKRKKK